MTKSYVPLIETGFSGSRTDVTPVFADPASFSALINDLTRPFSEIEIDLVAGIDALGFILGAAIAIKLGVGFIPIRKGGKLPGAVDSKEFFDYSDPAVKQTHTGDPALCAPRSSNAPVCAA